MATLKNHSHAQTAAGFAVLLTAVGSMTAVQGVMAAPPSPIWDVLPAAQLLVPATVLGRPGARAAPLALPPPSDASGELPATATNAPIGTRTMATPAAYPVEAVRPLPLTQAAPAPQRALPLATPVETTPTGTPPATSQPAPVAASTPVPEPMRKAELAPQPSQPSALGSPVLPGNDLSQSSSAVSLKMANSLAWSNRLDDAIVAYEALVRDPAQAPAARVPLANAYRWTGRPDLALPLYQDAVRAAPGDTGATDGLEYVQRDLRPRTTLELGTNADSGDLANHMGALRHVWRDASLKQVFEVETEWRNSLQGPIGPRARSNAATVRYAHTGLAWQPEVTLGAQTTPHTRWLGGLRVKLAQLPVHVEVAHENFGATSFSARALAAGLTANRLSVDGSWGGSAGVLTGRADWYRISDDNSLRTASLKATPSWRPLGLWFKPYVSLDTRDVKFNSPAYWSPVEGSGSVGLGAIAEWSEKDWFFYMAGQLGARVYGEAGSSWSASVGGQRWLNKDTALTLNLWGMSSQRNQARYRAHSLGIKLDRLW